MSKNPKDYTDENKANHAKLMIKTNALHVDNKPESKKTKSSKADKWKYLLSDRREYEGKGVVVIPSDPNALLERLDLLLESKEAGHTGVENVLVSICDELQRQCVLDTRSYKKLNSVIEK